MNNTDEFELAGIAYETYHEATGKAYTPFRELFEDEQNEWREAINAIVIELRKRMREG